MRYEDTSGTFSSAAAGTPDARDDSDNLAAGSRSPATGNAISGEGTITGAAGADIIGNAPGHIVALQGANGADTADSGGSLSAAGRFGTLTMNQDGGYSYRTSGPAPENARDVFSYTLADQSGARDTALLAIDIGHTPSVAANAQQIVPGADGVVTLPAGVELSDVHVVGRNLVIDMPDGSQMVIIDGAVFVPQLVLNGVEVPSSNLAALLVDSEPKPGAGTPQSGGGNFAVDVGPLDPGVPLGDLLPPTDLSFTPPEFEEPNQIPDDEPEILIIPDGQPGAVNAVDSVDESGLPERDGEPEGTLEPQAIESTTGVISISGDDDIDSVTINGVEIDSIGDTVETDRGILTITSIDLDSGEIGYSYTATDNTTDGVDDFDDFTVVVTDDDGDTATGTLHIDILDDEPIARDDTDSVTLDNPTAVGNVMTAVGTTNSPAGLDVVGADDATLTAVQGVGPADTLFDINGNLVVQGEYGTLTIDAEGNYTYELTGELPEAADTDVFTYTLTDGDGDTATATLTITIPGNPNDIPEILSAENTLVDEDGLDGANVDDGRLGEVDSTESTSGTGQILVDFKGDVPAVLLGAIVFINPSALNGQLTNPDGDPITFSVNGSGQLVGSDGTNDVIIIEFTEAVPQGDGQVLYTYTVELLGPVEHPVEGFEDTIELEGITVQVTDSNGDTDSATFDVAIVDDLPIAVEPPENPQDPEGPPIPITGGAVDEDDLDTGNNDVALGDDLPIGSPTTVNGAAGSLAALFSAGADQPLTFALSSDTLGLPTLHSGGVEVTYFVDGDTLTALAGGETVFTLTVNPDGSWAFELEGQLDHPDTTTEDNIDIDFSSVIIAEDADGDPVTAAAGAFVINVDDDSPTAIIPPPVDPQDPESPTTPLVSDAVDEDDLPDGNNDDAPGDDIATNSSTTVNGAAGSLAALFNAGADQPLVFAISPSTTGLPELFSNGDLVDFMVDGDTLTATAGGDPVFTLIVNPDGSWSFELEGQLDHPDTATEDNLLLDFSSVITATDADGDPVTAAEGAFVINIDDDSPTVTNIGAQPILVVDDTFLATGATENFAGAFAPSFGSDGPGAVPVSYTLGVVAGASGLVDTATGENVILSLNGNVVEGHTEFSNDLVFTVSVDADGLVTLIQSRAVEHDDPADDDEPGDSAAVLSADDLITLTATVTDGDGDTVTTSIDIGENLQFKDDGPSIIPTGEPPILVVDETDLDADAIEDFSGAFTPSFGNDGAGAVPVSYALDVVVGASGLIDTATGESVILSLNGDVVEGRTESSGDLVFTVSVDADGLVTLDQLRAVRHDDTADPDEELSPATLNADNLITLTATVTDGDGDTAATSIDIGQDLLFEDDGPTAIDDADSVIGGVDPATGNVITGVDIVGGDANTADGVADSVGADTPGTITGIVSDNNGNVDISYDGADNLVVTGQYGELTINKDGSYSYTRTDLGAAGVSDIFTYTLTDGDGDTTTATLTIGIDDNFPNAGSVEVQLDDDALAGGNPDGPSDDADPIGDAGNLPGSDGDIPLTWAILTTGTPPDGFTYEAGAANEVLIKQGTITVLTITITDPATGAYTVVQNAPIVHDSQDGSGSTDDTENNVEFTINYTVTDNDGDVADGTINIDVDDDTPTVTNLGIQPDLVVDETILTTDDTQSFADAFTVSYGADGAATSNPLVYSLAVIEGPSGLLDTATGESVILTLNGDVVEGRTENSDDLVFTVSVDADGLVTLDQLRAVVHNDALDPDEPGNSAATLSADELITLTAAATDSDGDTVTTSIAIGENLRFEDDGPEATLDTNTVTEGDTLIVVEADGVLSNDDFGTDGPGTIVGVEAGDDTSSPVTGGVGSPIIGSYGTLTLQANGSYQYASTDGAVPPAGATDMFVYTIVDADGDSSTVTLTITLNNDNQIPEAGEASAAVDDDGLTGGLAGGDGDIDADAGEVGAGVGDESVYTGTLDGTGGDAPVTFLFDATLDGTTDTVGTETVEYTVSLDGLTLTANVSGGDRDGLELFNVVITDASTGAYTLTLVDNVLHEEGGNDETSAFLDIPYQMSDLDGDNSVAPGTLHVEFNDDTPEAFETDAVNVEQGSSASASLDIDDGDITDNYGADGGTVRFPPDIEGTEAEDANGDPLTSHGARIFYHIVDDTHLQGVLADGTTVVFTITLNETDVVDPNNVVGSSYTIELEEQIDSLTLIDFDEGGYELEGGNGAWFGFLTDANDNSPDLLITPSVLNLNAGTINSSDVLFGVLDGNSVDANETVRIDFITDLGGSAQGPGGYAIPGNRDHVYEGHYTTNGAQALIAGTSGSTVRVTAFDDEGDGSAPGNDGTFVVGDGTPDSIIGMAIRYNGETSSLITIANDDDGDMIVEASDSDGVAEVTVGGRAFTVTFNPDGTVDVGNVEGENGNNAEGTRIAVFTADGYTSLEFSYVAGDDFKIGDFGVAVQSTDPVPFSVPVQIVDGDGDVVGGTDLDITVYPVGGLPVPLAATSSFSTQESVSLLTEDSSTSDKSHNRSFDTANNNTVLLGAIAAAGLASTSAAAKSGGSDEGSDSSQLTSLSVEDGPKQSSDTDSQANHSLGGETQDAANKVAGDGGGSKGHSNDNGGDHSLTDGDAHETQAPSELLGGTDTPQQDAPAQSSFTSGGVAMPSAEMIAAAKAEAGSDGEAKSNAVVDQAVADALGHGDTSPIDMLLASLPGEHNGLEAIARSLIPVNEVVSGWSLAQHDSLGAGLDVASTIDLATFHHDAVPPTANG